MLNEKDALESIRAAEDEAVSRRQKAIEQARATVAAANKRAAEIAAKAETDGDAGIKAVTAEAKKKADAFTVEAAKKAAADAEKLRAERVKELDRAAMLIVSRLTGKA